jgi:hypothetical protein
MRKEEPLFRVEGTYQPEGNSEMRFAEKIHANSEDQAKSRMQYKLDRDWNEHIKIVWINCYEIKVPSSPAIFNQPVFR